MDSCQLPLSEMASYEAPSLRRWLNRDDEAVRILDEAIGRSVGVNVYDPPSCVCGLTSCAGSGSD
jgi:hypothetical protein